MCFFRESKFYTLIMLDHQRTSYLHQRIPLGQTISEAPFCVTRTPYPMKQRLRPTEEAGKITLTSFADRRGHMTQALPTGGTRCSDVKGDPCGIHRANGNLCPDPTSLSNEHNHLSAAPARLLPFSSLTLLPGSLSFPPSPL